MAYFRSFNLSFSPRPYRPLPLHLIMDQLDAIAALPDQKIKAEQYRAVLQTVLAQKQPAECKGFVDHCES